MGIEFKLTDRELPASPAFINFLARVHSGRGFDPEIWADQRSEALAPADTDTIRLATEAAALVMGSPAGRDQVAQAYGLLYSLLTGDMAPVRELLAPFHFVNVVGIPRTGGSYLTAEIYRALGMAPEHVPGAIAHDSFPEAAPFQLQQGINSWMLTLKTTAEYLVMVERFFAGQAPHGGKIVVPKKLTKGVYAGAFFLSVLGERAEYLVTLRHPVASCVSTYEKSGGLPAGGLFRVRSNIEEWCRRDLHQLGCSTTSLDHMDYFDAYLRYWENYHLAIAMTGLSASRALRVVAVSGGALQSAAQHYHDLYGSALQASEFAVSGKARRLHPTWIGRAQPAIERVAAAWKMAGIPFPADEISECW